MIAALFAALIGPFFINWNDFRGSFEARAEQLIGHKVSVNGTADATILPSPSLTFTDVVVGDPAAPMATVEQFDVTIELMPLLQGEIRVVSMKLLNPDVTLKAGAGGEIDWLTRTVDGSGLDANVILDHVEIVDGALSFEDEATGVGRSLESIRATVSSRALTGPWRVDDGSLAYEGQRYQFSLATGRVLDDGTLRVTTDVQPFHLPIDLAVDGLVGQDSAGAWNYSGTYNIRQVGAAAASGGENAGWRSEGAFRLDGRELDIDRAVWSTGPPDRPVSLAGSLNLAFGDAARFDVFVEANQIDLDRTLGSGPSEPLEVSQALERLASLAQAGTLPSIPGSLEVRIPVVVVGGSIVQGVLLKASTTPGIVDIDVVEARLPGQARIRGNGFLLNDDELSFSGDMEFGVLQPATFAGWWRGQAADPDDEARLLSAFEVAAEANIRPGRVDVDNMVARIGTSEIRGGFDWGEQTDGRRVLGSDLSANRIDVVQIQALARLLAGEDADDVNLLADDYHIRLSADEFATQDLLVREVVVDAAYTGDVLNVNQIAIGDFGGARIRVTAGQIKDLTSSNPVGELDGQIEAGDIDGVVSLVNRLVPGSPVAGWLTTAGPDLANALVNLRVTAPPRPGGQGVRIALDQRRPNNAVGLTVLNKLQLDLLLEGDWRENPLRFEADLTPLDPAVFLRQLGIAGVGTLPASGELAGLAGSFVARGDGIPSQGIDSTVDLEVAGVRATGEGVITLAQDEPPSFFGTLNLESDDIDPAIALMGLAVPGAAIGTPVEMRGISIDASSEKIAADWLNARFADRVVNGDLEWLPIADGSWRMGGALAVSEVDLDWMMALGLGFAPLPTGDPEAMWSSTPFSSPAQRMPGKVLVNAERLYIPDNLEIANAQLDIGLAAQRIDIALKSGEISGGRVEGGLALHNVGGNARVAGQFRMEDAALEDFVWRRGDRPIATGSLDLSANFEATGQSPSGLVTSLTGGGVIDITEGEARYINPNTAQPIIRESDLGGEFDEASLTEAVEAILAGGGLAFGSATTPFDIAAGTMRVKNMALRSESFEARGDAVLDFNRMTAEADWALTFDPADTKVEEAVPEVAMVFQGAIAAPDRSLDVVPFLSYLNLRLAARELEILELEQADRLEKERLRRLLRKFGQDAARRERERLAAIEAERLRLAASQRALAALEGLHEVLPLRSNAKRIADTRIAAETARTAADQARQQAAGLGVDAVAARAEADAAVADRDAAIELAGTALAERDGARNTLTTAAANLQAALQERDDAALLLRVAEDTLSETTAAQAADQATSDEAEQARDDTARVAEVAAANAESSSNRAEAARADMSGAAERRAVADESHSSAMQAVTDAGATLIGLEIERDRIAGEREATEQEVVTAEEALVRAGAENEAALSALASAQGAIGQAEAVSATASEAVVAAQAQLDEARAASEAALARVTTVEGLAASTTSEAEKRVADDFLATVKAQAEVAATALSDAESAFEGALETQRRADLSLEASLSDLAEREREATSAENALVEAQSALEATGEQAVALSQAIEQTETDIVAAERQLDRLRTAASAAEASMLTARSEAEEATARLASALAELQQTNSIGIETATARDAAADAFEAARSALEDSSVALEAAVSERDAAVARAATADQAHAEAANALQSAVEAEADGSTRFDELSRAREIAVSAAETGLAVAEEAERVASQADVVATDLEARADRAEALADRVAAGGVPSDEPPTYPELVPEEAVETDTAAEESSVTEPATLEPVTVPEPDLNVPAVEPAPFDPSRPATPPVPKLRPARGPDSAAQIFPAPTPDQPLVITPIQ